MEKEKILHLLVLSFSNTQMCLEALFTVFLSFIYYSQ